MGHGHVSVNGRRVTIPSYRVSAGDVVEVRQRSRAMSAFQWNVDVLDRVPPVWLEVVDEGWVANIVSLPTREQIDVPIREQLIVELYSK